MDELRHLAEGLALQKPPLGPGALYREVCRIPQTEQSALDEPGIGIKWSSLRCLARAARRPRRPTQKDGFLTPPETVFCEKIWLNRVYGWGVAMRILAHTRHPKDGAMPTTDGRCRWTNTGSQYDYSADDRALGAGDRQPIDRHARPPFR